MELEVTPAGLEIPTRFHDAESVVIRTPTGTVDISSGFSGMLQDGFFPLVQIENFTVESDEKHNDGLSDTEVSIKPYSEPETVYAVNIDDH